MGRSATEPGLDAAGELKRIRKELTRRRRAPWRVIIASDPERPVHTLVLPRALPKIVLGVATCLVLLAAGSSLTSLRLESAVGDLQGRVGSMVHAAEELARHPLPHGMSQASPVPVAVAGPVRQPSGQVGRFELESADVSGIPVPKTLLAQMVNYFTRTADNPKGSSIDDTFELPAEIRRIDIATGRFTVVQ
jgi:hypothetical protein